MPGFRFTPRAEADLQEIADYTLRTWGRAQCVRYLDKLERRCERLANSPGLGLACDDIRAGYFRAVAGQHVLFFRKIEDGILIVRVLHSRMLPEKHLSDVSDDSDEI
jgi:toxin ParE1/3/4